MIQENKNEVEVIVTDAYTEVNEEEIIEKDGVITISLPQSIINKINENAITKTMLFKAQVYFLCWLINRGDKIIGQKGFNSKSYQLHHRAHQKLYKTGGQFEKLRDFLIDIEIIKCISNHSKDNNTAKVYVLNNPFNHMNKGNELIHFDTSFYNFAKNFKEANYLILPKNEAKKANKIFTTWENKEVSQPVDNKELEQLKEENRLMKVELEQLKQLIMQGKVNTIKEEINIEEAEKYQTPDVIGSNIEYNDVELTQPADDDLMNKSLLVDDLEDENFNKEVEEWDKKEAKKKEVDVNELDIYIIKEEYVYTPSPEEVGGKTLAEVLADFDN